MRERYFLDTCSLIWLLNGDKRINTIINKIDDGETPFAISVDSLKEILYKQKIGKLKLDFTFKQLVNYLKKERKRFHVLEFNLDALYFLEKMPLFDNHKDPNDRAIIASCMAYHTTMITGDAKFRQYEKYGLDLVLI